jgi:hypothetical protein
VDQHRDGGRVLRKVSVDDIHWRCLQMTEQTARDAEISEMTKFRCPQLEHDPNCGKEPDGM